MYCLDEIRLQRVNSTVEREFIKLIFSFNYLLIFISAFMEDINSRLEFNILRIYSSFCCTSHHSVSQLTHFSAYGAV
jgi:hypothetical protein